MRKLILIIALTMVPLGIWTAGCRNDDGAAAFPDTPETRKLAKSREKVSEVAARDEGASASAPVIPPKPIDREILNLPGYDTLARIQAVNDRANLYAAQVASGEGRGLFTLPEEKNYVASAFSPAAPKRGLRDAAGTRGEPEALIPPIPAPGAREFWSKPVASRSGRSAGGTDGAEADIPGDVSAMAPPAFSPAPLERPVERAAPSAFILPPENMPGLFMPGEEQPLSSRRPARARRGWFGALERRAKAEVTEDAAAVSAAFTPFPQIAEGARIVSSEGMDFEPLPEPIPLARYNDMVLRELEKGVPAAAGVRALEPASVVKAAAKAEAKSEFARKANELMAAPVLPLPAALVSGGAFIPPPAAAKTAAPAAPVVAQKAIAAPAIPELTEPKTAAPEKAVKEAAVAKPAAKALAPLPGMTALLPVPAKSSMKGSAGAIVSLPEPMTKEKALPTPEAIAAKAELMDFGAKAKIEEPRKIVLEPMRKGRFLPGLEKIDAATEVPPMKF